MSKYSYKSEESELSIVEESLEATVAVPPVAHNNDSEEALTPSTSLSQKLDEYRNNIYSIAILLTGSVEDAESVVDEVFNKISFNLGEHAGESLEAVIHRYTYDASLEKLLYQVDTCAAELEETGSKILNLPTYLC